MCDGNLQEEIIQTLEFGEAKGWADEFASAPEDWGCDAVNIGGAYIFLVPKYDNPTYNKVIGLGLTEPATEDMIDKILKLYQDGGIQNYAFQICPAARPPSISEKLSVRGINPIFNSVKMYIRTDQEVTAATDLRIERIGPEYSNDYSRIFCKVFGLPDAQRLWIAGLIGRTHWRHYLAFDGDSPVGTGALYVNGQVGVLLGATTLESHRKRGAQSALLAKRIEDARVMGGEWIVAETWEEEPGHHNPSYQNMLRIGFHLAYTRPNFMMRE